ncbi:unnamed protein product [Brassica oleracea var. botrytis]
MCGLFGFRSTMIKNISKLLKKQVFGVQQSEKTYGILLGKYYQQIYYATKGKKWIIQI